MLRLGPKRRLAGALQRVESLLPTAIIPNLPDKLRIMIVAGEASGDVHAAAWRRFGPRRPGAASFTGGSTKQRSG